MTPEQAIGHITTNRYLIMVALADDGAPSYRYSRIHDLMGHPTSLYKDLIALESIGVLSAEPPYGRRGKGTKVVYRFHREKALLIFDDLRANLAGKSGGAR